MTSRSAGGNATIATFNINDVNKRLENLLTWLAKTKPVIAA
jgi:exonuclease III